MATPATCRCTKAAARPAVAAVAAPIAQAPLPAQAAASPFVFIQPPAVAAIAGRQAAAWRAARLRQVQRVAGNHAAQRLVQRFEAGAVERAPERSRAPEALWIQRDGGASAASNDVRGDAATQEAEVRNDATARANDLDRQGQGAGAPLQSQAGAQSALLQGDAAAKGAALGQQSAAQGAALRGQASTQAARLNGESAAQGAALQQEANGTSTRLQGDEGALEAAARATESSADGALTTDASVLQNDAQTSATALQGQWASFETQTTGRLNGMTARTQALADQKAALVKEYQSPGAHDPERFQRRWAALQSQVGPLQQEEAALDRVGPAGTSIGERASAAWDGLTGRGQALLDRVGGLAGTAWNALQGRWTTLQGAAAGALAALQGRAAAAVGSLKALAASAWTGLQGAATQAWTGLQGIATGAWTGLQAGASAAWTALQGQATAAWTALQGIASSAVGSLSSKISGILGRIGSAIGRIVDAITDALGSVMSRLRSATSSALDFLRTRASAAWSSVKGLGERAWNGLKDLGTRAWNGVKDLGSRAWNGLKDLGTRAWNGLKDLGTRAWNGLKDLGTRAWNGLKDLGTRAWNGLKSGWEWVKKKAQAAWTWLKGAWEALKRKAAQAWDWIKRKAREALAWLKQKWTWLKGLVAKGWAWLKAKWKWLKELVKITIRIPDQTLCKVHNFKPWKFVDIQGGRIPIVKTVVDPGIGPVELALFVQANAQATIGGTIGPCTVKNIQFTLQPLVSRYTGQADFHVAGSAVETLALTGTIGGTANYGGLIGLVGGGLEGKGSATALGSFGAKPRFVYDSGNVSLDVPVSFEFCLMPQFDLGAFVTAKLIAGQPPAAATPSPTPVLPGPPALPGPAPFRIEGAGGCWKKGAGGGGNGGGGSGGKPPKEEILKEWTKRWHLGSWSKKECWRLGARFQLVAGPGGMPQAELHFDAAPMSMADVVRHMFDLPPLPGGGAGGGSGADRPPGGARPDDPEILKTVTASGRCKCVGDDNCGGGKIYQVCYTTQKDCKKAQKDLDDFCNNNSEMKGKCTRPKCYYRHSDPCCPDECSPGDIRPLETDPVGPQASCNPAAPSGGPTVNNPAGGNTCTPDIPRPTWDVIEADAANWGVCVSALPLSGTINIKPWPAQPNRMVTPNTANPQDGGNIENTAGSKNHWQYAINDMADYDTAGGGAGPDWHATPASEAHEWAHWNLDFKDDALTSAAGGDWARANSELNALREPKSSSATPADARTALQPKVDARVATFRSAVLGRWNSLITTTDKPGKGGRGYAAGSAVLNQIIANVRAYKDFKGW